MPLRVASEADVPVLSGLIETSVRELQRGDYTPLQIELALRKVYGRHEAHGYTRRRRVDAPLPGGEKLAVVHMVKTILPI